MILSEKNVAEKWGLEISPQNSKKTLWKVARFSSSEGVKEKKRSRFELGKFLYIRLTEFGLWIDIEPVRITLNLSDITLFSSLSFQNTWVSQKILYLTWF